MTDKLIHTILIVGIIVLLFTLAAIVYITITYRRRSIVMKKIDYLVEDVTYKSEMLNSPVETISKISNYIDAFEVVAKKNMKSATRLVARNKDDFYKIMDRIKKAATGENKEEDAKKSSKKKGGKK